VADLWDNRIMTIQEYIKVSHKELDDMLENYLKENAANPEFWPLDREYEDWGEDELATRFQ